MARASPRRALEVAFAPTSPSARLSGIALAVLRILAGLMWLANVIWKWPPDFGENGRTGLYFWTHQAVDHPVFPRTAGWSNILSYRTSRRSAG